MKKKNYFNIVTRICILTMLIASVGIITITMFAKENNVTVETISNGFFGIPQTVTTPSNSFTIIQIIIIFILFFLFFGSILYLFYSKFGTIDTKEVFKNKEKTILSFVEIFLTTVLCTVIFVVLTQKYILPTSNISTTNQIKQSNNFADGNTL